jgi:hypothetical protein
MGFLHAGQCDGGCTTDSPFGIRTIQTLRKLPTIAPKAVIEDNKRIDITS